MGFVTDLLSSRKLNKLHPNISLEESYQQEVPGLYQLDGDVSAQHTLAIDECEEAFNVWKYLLRLRYSPPQSDLTLLILVLRRRSTIV